MGKRNPVTCILLAMALAVAGNMSPVGAAPLTSAMGVVVGQRQVERIIDIIFAQKSEPVLLEDTISLGMIVSGNTEVTPLPNQVVAIVPEFANHAYIVLGDGRVVIVEPTDLRVVAILGMGLRD